MKYLVGTKIKYIKSGIIGEVIEDFSNKICIKWENKFTTSYDIKYLDENCTLINEEKEIK